MWYSRHKSLALAILLGGVSVALIIFALIPIYHSAATLLGKIKTKSSEIENLNSKVAVLSKLDPVVLQERISILDGALPPNKDILLYLTSIDSLSKELGLVFGGLSLSPGDVTEASGSAKKVASKPGLQTIETEVKINGSQESVYTFLRTIEDVLPLMQIKNVKVSVLGTDLYSLSLTLAMLWAESETTSVKGAVALFDSEEDKYFTQLSGYRRFGTTSESIELTGDSKEDIFEPYGVTIPQQ